MKRSMTLLLPLLAVLASCGTTAQYSQQRYQDGIYFQTTEEPEEVVVLSKEDFERLAAQNIRQQSLEEVVDSSKITYTQVYPGDYYYDMYFSPFPTIALWAGTDLAFTSWYWDRWRLWWGPYGPMGPYDTFWFDFNRPYFGWGSWGWYDPWYYGGYGWGWGWRDPWAPYWDPWYYRSGWYRYDPWYHYGYGGGGFIRNVFYGPRYQTQPVGSRTIHAGSGASVTRGTTPVYGTRTTPATRTTNGTVTRISPSGTGTDRSLSEGYNRRAVTPSTGRSGSGSSGSYNRSTSSPSSRTYSRPSTSSSSSRTYSRPSTSSSSTRSYSSGSSSRSYSSGSTSSSSSRSYSSGGGGGFSSGGGHSSSGSASHSGGGGGSHGGRR